MGFKISIILLFLLISTVIGSATYIQHLQEQLAILKGNQVILEDKIAEQNESIDNYLAKQEQTYFQIEQMEAEKNQAVREVSTLRNKFARHDMNSLALAKPKLLEKRVNNGTRKVMQGLIALTDPNQFNPLPIVTNQGSSPPKENENAPEGDISEAKQ